MTSRIPNADYPPRPPPPYGRAPEVLPWITSCPRASTYPTGFPVEEPEPRLSRNFTEAGDFATDLAA